MQMNLVRSMMLLFFNGCSNTWGGELGNLSDRYSRIVCNHFGIEEVNYAQCGLSNDKITINTIKMIPRLDIDHVFIQFTVPPRRNWYNDRGRERHWTPSQRDEKYHNNHARNQWYKSVYNRHIGIENMWKNIFLFDTYCKKVGQKYTALFADHWKDDLDINSYWKAPAPLRLHRDIIKDESLLLEHKHPSPEGHKRIAEVIIKHVCS